MAGQLVDVQSVKICLLKRPEVLKIRTFCIAIAISDNPILHAAGLELFCVKLNRGYNVVFNTVKLVGGHLC